MGVNGLWAYFSYVVTLQVICASFNIFLQKVTWFSLVQICHGLRMCTKTPTVAQLTYSNTLLCVWDPVSYFLSPGKTGEMKAALSDMSQTYQTQTLEELQRRLWFWASSLVSCFDELIQNPDLSHRQNVDPGLNWTLPVMCKFTSVSTINKSLSEGSLDRFSLISASLISPEKELLFSKSNFSV